MRWWLWYDVVVIRYTFLSSGIVVNARRVVIAQYSFVHIKCVRFSVELGLNDLRKTANASALGIPGATHIEDMYYLFRMNLFNPDNEVSNKLDLSTPEEQMIKKVVKFFTNFVKYG